MDSIFRASKDGGPNLTDIVIRSESDAYKVLHLAAKGKIPDYNALIFDGWPSLNIYLKGPKFHQSITPTVMKGLLEFQKSIYRSYAVAGFGDPSKRLTDEEKKDLEIKIDVKKGSSQFDINFTEIATKLIEALGARMSPTEVLCTVVSVAALYFGNSAYRSFLETRKEVKLKEISDATQRQTLESLQFASAQETRRVQIIADLAKQQPRISEVREIASESHAEIVKTLTAGEQARVGDVPLSPEVAGTLIQGARRKAHDVRLDGRYKIQKIDWSDPLRFKARIYSQKSGVIIDAEVQDQSMNGKHKKAIQDAEWSRKEVDLKINAKTFGDGTYKEAVIISATLPGN